MLHLNLSKPQTQFLAGIVMAFLTAGGVLLHAATGGLFHLPASVITVLVLLAPVADQTISWMIHGLATGDWTPPWQPAQPTLPPAPGAGPLARYQQSHRHG